MNEMIEMCAILRRDNPGKTYKQLGVQLGVSSGMIEKNVSGVWNSLKLADRIADECGGECIALRDQIAADVAAGKGGAGTRSFRGIEQKQYETHNMPEIDPDNILALLLPVLYPWPVYLGEPSWAQ